MNINAISSGFDLQNTAGVGLSKAPNSDLFGGLWGAVQNMNDTQVQADNTMQQVLTGQSDDVQGSLIDLEKAQLQMSLASTVRDKLTQGFQQITNMQL